MNLTDLADKLDLEQSALEGMIAFWVRKGRLKENESGSETLEARCKVSTCARSCPGPRDCHFALKIPRTYSLTLLEED